MKNLNVRAAALRSDGRFAGFRRAIFAALIDILDGLDARRTILYSGFGTVVLRRFVKR